MHFWHRLVSCTAAVWLALALAGCAPPGSNPADEVKEPHYILGQSRFNAMEYDGAVEAFEQALEVNPHSAQAHFQLGMLYDQKVPDPAAAIYHYQQYLKYNPNAGNAYVVTQHIQYCKETLASNVMVLPGTSAALQQIQQLADEKRRLQDQVTWWQTQYTNLLVATRVTQPVAQNNHPSPVPDPVPTQNYSAPGANPTHPAPSPAAGRRKYVVASGETAASIARKSGVKLSALQAANPGVNLAKIRVGQILNLPSS